MYKVSDDIIALGYQYRTLLLKPKIKDQTRVRNHGKYFIVGSCTISWQVKKRVQINENRATSCWTKKIIVHDFLIFLVKKLLSNILICIPALNTLIHSCFFNKNIEKLFLFIILRKIISVIFNLRILETTPRKNTPKNLSKLKNRAR